MRRQSRNATGKNDPSTAYGRERGRPQLATCGTDRAGSDGAADRLRDPVHIVGPEHPCPDRRHVRVERGLSAGIRPVGGERIAARVVDPLPGSPDPHHDERDIALSQPVSQAHRVIREALAVGEDDRDATARVLPEEVAGREQAE